MIQESTPRPWMTVVIATYNSSRFLDRISENLKDQVAPSDSHVLEVLIVDGGSTDDTVSKAKDFGFTVLNNPDGDPISAKFIGLNHASAQLMCILDHDEFLIRTDSLLRKYEFFQQVKNLRAVVSAGYQLDADSSSNMYASEYGDPVSMMIYRTPNNEKYKRTAFCQHLGLAEADDRRTVFIAASERKPLLCEMAAGAGVIDVDFFRNHHPEMFRNKNIFPHAYYLLNSTDAIGMINGDSVIHDSAENWQVVRAKIAWRLNNALNETDISESGFSGRSHSLIYSPGRQKRKFLMYCLSIVGPLKDAIWLSVTRKRWGYLNHFFLTYFVLFKTIRIKIHRLAGAKVSNNRYGEN
jgi:glycosyltransferase involved in cell wall biosynthesis